MRLALLLVTAVILIRDPTGKWTGDPLEPWFQSDMLNADLATGCDIVIVVSCFALEVVGGIKNPEMATIDAALIAELGTLRNIASTLAVITPNEAFLSSPPWTVEVFNNACFVVIDSTGHKDGA